MTVVERDSRFDDDDDGRNFGKLEILPEQDGTRPLVSSKLHSLYLQRRLSLPPCSFPRLYANRKYREWKLDEASPTRKLSEQNSPTGLFVQPFCYGHVYGVIVVEFSNGQGKIWKISPSPEIPFVRCFREERERKGLSLRSS